MLELYGRLDLAAYQVTTGDIILMNSEDRILFRVECIERIQHQGFLFHGRYLDSGEYDVLRPRYAQILPVLLH